MNQIRTIEIIGDANRISLELLHRDFPEEQDYADGNWVTARFRVDNAGSIPSLVSLAALLTQVEAVLEQFPIRSPHPSEGRTDDSFAVMIAYLGRGGNPNHHLYGGRTLLSVAAQMGQIEAVRLLLDAGADLHDVDTTGTTALWGAAGNGRLDTVRLLLERGTRIDGPDGTGDTILMLAARNGDEEGCSEVVRLLLEAGANAQARDADGWTALAWAAGFGHEATVELLLKHGADPDAATEGGVTPLMCAAKGGHMGIVRLLRLRGGSVPS